MAAKSSKLGVGIALLAALVGLLVFAGVRFLFFGLDEATPWDKPAVLVDATPDPGARPGADEEPPGGRVALTYEGRECRDRVDVEVEEDPSAVVITITESVRTLVCGDGEDLATYDVVVDLDEPLGDRELVDGACRLGRFATDARCADDLPRIGG